MIVPAPDPHLSVLRERCREVTASIYLYDERSFRRIKDRIVGLMEVLNLLELWLVLRVPPSKQAEVAFAGGVQAPFCREDNCVLMAACHLSDLLALFHELLDQHRALRTLLTAVPQRTGPMPKAATPSPCPKFATFCDCARMERPQSGADNPLRVPLGVLEGHDIRISTSAEGNPQRVISAAL